MKRFVAALLTLISLPLLAATNAPNQQLILAWDRSPDDRLTNGITYTIYGEVRMPTVTNYVSIAGITNNTVGINSIAAGSWTFYATARQGAVESVPSNVLLVAVPNPPANLRTVILQYSAKHWPGKSATTD